MRRLDRWWWLVNLALLAALAFLAAKAINNRVAAEIATLPTRPQVAEATVSVARDVNAPDGWAESIANRNLFNSDPPEPELDDGGDDDDEEEDAEPVGKLPGPTDECERAEGDLKLLATMVADPADESMAVLAEGRREDNQRLVRPGSRVEDGGVVAAIYRRRAVIWQAERFGCLELGEDPPRASRRPTTTRAKAAASKPGFNKDLVKKVGTNRYEIDRSAVNEAMEDLGALSRQIRIRPHSKSGKMVGFRILRVQNNTMFDAIGLQRGDILQSVNGETVDNAGAALQLLDKLKNASNLTLTLERRGKPVDVEYSIK